MTQKCVTVAQVPPGAPPPHISPETPRSRNTTDSRHSTQLFAPGEAQHALLTDVLEAYACSRPDLGYVQGMSYLAAMLCVYTNDAYEAFKCLANLMVDRRSHLFIMYNVDAHRITRLGNACMELVRKKQSALYVSASPGKKEEEEEEEEEQEEEQER